MNSNVRTCKQCNTNQKDVVFHGALCADCYNSNRRRKRIVKKQKRTEDELISYMKKTIPNTISETKMKMVKMLVEINSMVVSYTDANSIDDVVNKIHELLGILDHAREHVLIFDIPVSQNTTAFLKRIATEGCDVATAEHMMRKHINSQTFLDSFNLTPETADNCYDEVIKIKDATDAIKAAYNVMVSDKNREIVKIAKLADLTVDENKKKNYVDVMFDTYTNEISVEPNDLQYTGNMFKAELQKIIKQDRLELKGFYQAGAYDFILN